MLRVLLCGAALALCACSRERHASDAPPPAADAGVPHATSAARSARAPLFVYECVVGGNHDLCTVPAGGGTERRITTHAAGDMWPRFTRDGRSVVFSSERTGTWQLWEAAPDGSAQRQLRVSPAREWQSDPSPDGRRLAFLSDAGGEESLRVVAREGVRAGGAGRLLLSQGRRVVMGNPHWSPDGSRVVLSTNAGHAGHHVYVVDARSGEARRVSPLLSGACEPRFSPDGRKVAYVRRQRLTRARSAIVELDLDTGRVRPLVDWPAINYDPAYSPDGSEIAFVSTIAAPETDLHAIYRQRLSDGKAWRVTFEHDARHPDYAPR
jgi:Tol biopolymer transport system component